MTPSKPQGAARFKLNSRKVLVTLILGLLLQFVPAGFSTAAFTQGFTEEQKKSMEKIIQDYLLKNPTIIRDALDALRLQEEEQKQKEVAKRIRSRSRDLQNDPSAPVLGNPNGDVTVVEFFDYNCGYCKRSFPVLKALIESDRSIRLVMKEFAILGPNSVTMAKAALAAKRQGKYLELHEAFMLGDQFEEKMLEGITKKVGLDYQKLLKDMEDRGIAQSLQKNYQLAEDLGINGTPAFIIGDNLVPGAIGFDALKKLISDARSKPKTPSRQ